MEMAATDRNAIPLNPATPTKMIQTVDKTGKDVRKRIEGVVVRPLTNTRSVDDLDGGSEARRLDVRQDDWLILDRGGESSVFIRSQNLCV